MHPVPSEVEEELQEEQDEAAAASEDITRDASGSRSSTQLGACSRRDGETLGMLLR